MFFFGLFPSQKVPVKLEGKILKNQKPLTGDYRLTTITAKTYQGQGKALYAQHMRLCEVLQCGPGLVARATHPQEPQAKGKQ